MECQVYGVLDYFTVWANHISLMRDKRKGGEESHVPRCGSVGFPG